MEHRQESESQEKKSGNEVNDPMEADAESSNEQDAVCSLNPNKEDNEPKERQNPFDRMPPTFQEYVVEVLCKENESVEASVESYFCPDIPKDIRKHVIILEKLLSDSEDLPDCTDSPIPDRNKAVSQLKIESSSISEREYVEMYPAYIEIQNRHDVVRDLVYRSIDFQQRCLEVVSRCLLKLCNEIYAENMFAKVLQAFLYSQSFSRLYVECIEDDAKHLDDIRNKLETIGC
ncbi:uncharacterized protein TNIN_206081 [Trichonephila inaurata madagascariensis]|uniref:Uncharacterized protein n=1 Tax=Trichonephila inaurata madagascariensis TaxID=2747483 RepID=A0A8X6XT96_9ARAC|nr:uncharacterized protein TNIN_206081 [Trichonephila inaurata madagascariensis]